jgi:hypothetical protein
MRSLGFTRHVPHHWSKWWLAMWGATAPTVIVTAFFLDFLVWLPIAIIGFLVPELISVVKQDDRLAPLTHTIRHFVPDWAAFPLIYFALGSVGAHWLEFPEPLRLGALLGLLGWLTDHFSVTYTRPDPSPTPTHSRPHPPQGVEYALTRDEQVPAVLDVVAAPASRAAGGVHRSPRCLRDTTRRPRVHARCLGAIDEPCMWWRSPSTHLTSTARMETERWAGQSL